MLALLLALAALLAGCSDSPGVCSTCPKVEGHYTMVCALDGGSQSASCTTVQPPSPPTAFDLTRSGASLHASLNGISTRGVLVENQDFSLSGTDDSFADAGNTQTVSLHGYFLTRGADAGSGWTFNARWTTHNEQGAKFCDAEQQCVGTSR